MRRIREQGLREQFYAIVEVNSRPYSIAKNDVLVIKRMPGTKIGDVVSLTRVREIGSKDYYIRGAPLVETSYVEVQAVVLEHTVSAKYTKYRKRLGKGPGDRKWRKKSYRDRLTVLRVDKLEVKDL